MYKFKILAALIVGLSMAACSSTPNVAKTSQVQVNLYSNPTGAVVYENGVYKGTTPLSLIYTANEFKQYGCANTPDLKVQWVSGVETLPQPIQLCGFTGYYQEYTFSRPQGSGMDKDLAHAAVVERNMLIAQQNAAAQQQADSAVLWQGVADLGAAAANGYAAGLDQGQRRQSANDYYESQQPVVCTSNIYDALGQIRTECR